MKTIKIALSLLTLSLCSLSSFAQNENYSSSNDRQKDLPKNEISVSFGLGIGSTVDANDHNKHCSSFKNVPLPYSNNDCVGFGYTSFNARYMRSISRRFAVGLSFIYAGDGNEWLTYDPVTEMSENGYGYWKPLFDWNGDGVVNDGDYKEGPCYDPMASVNYVNYYVLPAFRAFWFSKRFVAMYSMASFGIRLTKVSELDTNPHDNVDFTCNKTDIGFAWNVVPAGVEVGGRHVRFFSEMSFNHIGVGLELGCRVRF